MSCSMEGAITLSTSEHPWPVCFSVAVSKLLDDAGIPNFLWGDLLNRMRGNPHLANVCGFVVPTAYLDKATVAISDAGLSVCSCNSSLHMALPASRTSLPIHFLVPQAFVNAILFLCPSNIFLDLIPLTPSHPNPASLEFDQLRASLHDNRLKVSIDNGQNPELMDGTYTMNVLTTQGLIKLLLLLYSFSPSDRIGVGYAHAFLLVVMASCGIPKGPHKFNSPSLQRLWNTFFSGRDMTTKTSETLRNKVVMEWKGIISPGSKDMSRSVDV